MQAIDGELREHIYAYLTQQEPFDVFEEWVVGNTEDAAPGGLVGAVDHLLVERHLIGEATFRERLHEALSSFVLSAPADVWVGSANVTRMCDMNMARHGNVTVLMGRVPADR